MPETHESVRVEPHGSPAPFNEYGGSANMGLDTATIADLLSFLSGDEHEGSATVTSIASIVDWLFALSGREWQTSRSGLQNGPITGRANHLSGTLLLGRVLRLDKVYRSADRITYVGVALDQGGNPLRQYQLQFIGETVQENFSGTATDLNGIFVAYLTVGDTYTAFAFDPRAGFVYELLSITSKPNSVELLFRLKTKRGGFGEGIFLGAY